MLPGYVEVTLRFLLRSSDSDDLEGRVALRIEQLPLQRLQTTAQNVGLGGVHLLGQPLEPLLLGGVQVDLDGLAHAFGWAAVSFMNIIHDIIIVNLAWPRHCREPIAPILGSFQYLFSICAVGWGAVAA